MVSTLQSVTLQPVVATNVAFYITFGVFVVAWLVLAFFTIRWAIRHDRAGFSAWRRRQAGAAPTIAPTIEPTNPGSGDAPPTSTP
jgi:hypothetical protein